jgi:hypothetical protein
MSERLKRSLVAFWLFLSFPLNVAELKHLIRNLFSMASMYAGLNRWIVAQYFLALIFVLWIIVQLMRETRQGHTVAVALVMGSCCTLIGQLLMDMIYRLSGHPLSWRPVGFLIFGAIFLLNLACLRVLITRTSNVTD